MIKLPVKTYSDEDDGKPGELQMALAGDDFIKETITILLKVDSKHWPALKVDQNTMDAFCKEWLEARQELHR